MKKIAIALIVVGLLIAPNAFAQEKRTRQYTPVKKQGSYGIEQASKLIWNPSTHDYIVMDSWTISSNSNQKVTLAASDTIVAVHVTASQPVVSPGAFLWKGGVLEVILITTETGDVEVTLTGWEEEN